MQSHDLALWRQALLPAPKPSGVSEQEGLEMDLHQTPVRASPNAFQSTVRCQPEHHRVDEERKFSSMRARTHVCITCICALFCTTLPHQNHENTPTATAKRTPLAQTFAQVPPCECALPPFSALNLRRSDFAISPACVMTIKTSSVSLCRDSKYVRTQGDEQMRFVQCLNVINPRPHQDLSKRYFAQGTMQFEHPRTARDTVCMHRKAETSAHTERFTRIHIRYAIHPRTERGDTC